jgi:N-acetylmuramoyl-L-alanine amidase
MNKLIIIHIFLILTITLKAQSETREVVAQSGDGIYSLLKKNGLQPSDFHAFVELNRSRLGPNNALIAGENTNYRLQEARHRLADTNSKARTYKIFGPKYQNVTIKSQQLNGATYYLNRGMGDLIPGP